MDEEFEKEKNRSNNTIDNNEQEATTDEKGESKNTQQEEMNNQTEELEKNQSVFNEPTNQIEDVQKKETSERYRRQPSFLKSNILVAILVGIISSALTLALVFNTPLLQDKLKGQISENSE